MDQEFKPNVLTVNEKEKTIYYTYINKDGKNCTAKFGYRFVGDLIKEYLKNEGIA